MKTRIIQMTKRLAIGDEFSVLKNRKAATFRVLARELGNMGHKNTYWVSVVATYGAE